MALRVRMIIGEQFHGGSSSPLLDVKQMRLGRLENIARRSGRSTLRIHGAVMNFWRARISGYFGKKTSALKTLFGVISRVAIDSLYSTCSSGLTTIVPAFSLTAWLSDHLVKIDSAEFRR